MEWFIAINTVLLILFSAILFILGLLLGRELEKKKHKKGEGDN